MRTVQANYYKAGVHNFLFRNDGYSATAILIEYDI